MIDKQEHKKPLKKTNIHDLRKLASTNKNIINIHTMNRAELIASIKKPQSHIDKTKKIDISIIRKTKIKIKATRTERDKLYANGANKTKINITRKRLRRLKKKTRQLATIIYN